MQIGSLFLYVGIAGAVLFLILNIVAVIRDKSACLTLSGFFIFVSMAICGLLFRNNLLSAILTWLLSTSLIIPLAYRLECATVKKTSIRYQFLHDIPDKHPFHQLKPEYLYRELCKSKGQIYHLQRDTMIPKVMADHNEIPSLVAQARFNQKVLTITQKKLACTPSPDVSKGFPYTSIEKRLTERERRAVTPTVPTFRFEFYVETKPGEREYKKSYRLTWEEVSHYEKEAKKNAVRRKMIAHERKELTLSLRNEILNRDGHRCRICGRTAADGVSLHIDHIIPVSKGGKSEVSNLRVLCEDCNLGKSDKYNPHGYN